MADQDLEGTQRDLSLNVAAELAAAGFDDAQEIGRGGFGVVYRCVEHALERTVAVKVLESDSGADERARFLREQRAMGRFAGHPHIVQVLRADITATGKPYLVMPFYACGSLRSRVCDNGPMPWQEVLSVGVKIAGALAVAHAAGIVHRDVNPSNILLSDYGEPQLGDFGIARIGGAFQTSAGLVAGTPAFTAPEVLRGADPTPVADIYGLGATLFCLLTGHAAFERRRGESIVAQFLRITSDPVPDLRRSGVPALLCAAIEGAMAQDPAARPATARELGERLRNIQFSCGLTVDAMALLGGTDTDQPAAAAPPVTVATMRPGPSPAPAPAPAPSTRYRPPTSRREPVQRHRLLDVLREGRSRRLVLIHGPAGFGKSTLAAEWVDMLADEGVRAAWLSVDLDDNNVVWFLSHVVEAVRLVHPDVAQELAQMLEERSSDAVRHVLATLIDEIHNRAEPVALVIDDWHRVTNPATIAAMEFLLDHGCDHLRLIVTSRSRRGLPLGRMRVRDELVEIDETGLRFDAEETAEFLAGADGLSLAAADVERLRQSTEGWAAALQLASLSLRGRDDPGACLDQISGRHYAIGEYLMENVIDALEPRMLEFVMRTAVPDRICGELAEALAGVSSGQELLEEVRQRDLFLRSIDDDLHWFRYHALFADFLRSRLVRRHPGLLEELHLKASDWFADHDLFAEAVDHALAAGEPERAVALVDAHAEELIEKGRNATFLGLVAKLPPSLTALNPMLQVHIAWASISLRRPADALAAVERADALLDAAPPGDETTAETRLEVDVVRTAATLVVDRPATTPEAVLARFREPIRPFLAHATALAAMVSALYRFDFDEVHRWHRRVEPYRDLPHGPYGPVYSDCIDGAAAYQQLDIDTAESRYRTALRQALETGGQSDATLLTSALLGELLYEKGQFIEAEELLAAHLRPEGGVVEFLLATYGTGVRVAAVRGDLETTYELLAEGAKIATNRSLQRLSARMLNERVRLGLPLTDAERLALEQLPPYVPHADAPSGVASELHQESAIRLLLAEGTAAAADRACRRSEDLVRGIATQDRPHALLNAELLHGCCLSATGRMAQAVRLLEPALIRCAEHGLVRVVVDSGEQLRPVIETLQDTTTSAKMRSFLRQVLAQFERVPQGRSPLAGSHAQRT
ncbi:protein kinase domain-containing protein [Nocardia sp. R7R-8]|uniref:protein kinase domain-containing protein n=1 Tax=Nocardia sp. R7R-8 TaxID=3459304 RepID=UPI00403DC66C